MCCLPKCPLKSVIGLSLNKPNCAYLHHMNRNNFNMLVEDNTYPNEKAFVEYLQIDRAVP